ncbi:MAG: hypothetical protein A2285_08270, partial [Elusimicrobia bacterium RIFOXYA12_FULL_57_11]
MFKTKKLILNLAVLAIALCAAQASAQVPGGISTQPVANGATVYLTSGNGTWQNYEWDMENNIAKDADGNIYMAGTFYNGSQNVIYIRKMNPVSGIEIWTSTFTGTGDAYGRGVALDGVGSLYVLGRMMDSQINKILVAKYNPATGVQVSSCSYDSGNGNNAYDIVADAAGAYVAGTTGNQIAVMKFPAGSCAVSKVNVSGGSYSSGYAIALSSLTHLVVSGTMNEETGYGNEIWLGKFNKSNLSQVWASTYTPAENHQYWGQDEAHAVKTDAVGNIYVVGFYQGQNTGNDVWLGKYDPSGNLIYTKTKNGPSNGYDKGYGVALDSVGNVYVTGKVQAYTLGQGDNLWLGKYSPSGSLISEVVADRGSEVGYDVEVGSVMVTVGGGFDDSYGLVTVAPEQFGTPQQLFAGPGWNTGSVNLSWVFESADISAYKIQYSTIPGTAWSPASAQVTESGLSVTSGDTRIHTLGGLPTFVTGQSGAAGNGVTGPAYYFKVWTSPDSAIWTELNVTTSVPYAPFNPWMVMDRGLDSFYTFNSARVPVAGMARDAGGNTYIAHAAGYTGMMQGLALSKVNPQGVSEWTSFHNSSSTNGRFNASLVVLDASGNIYVAGSAAFEGPVSGDNAWVAKFNSAGVLQWENILAGPEADGDDRFSTLALDLGGNVYAAGSVKAGSGENDDMLVARYSPSGAFISSATFDNGPASALPAEIWTLAIDASNNVYAGGYVSSPNGTAPDRDAVVLKLNSSLTIVSSHAYVNATPPLTADVETLDRVTGLAVDGAFLYASGMKSSNTLPQFWVAKLNPANLASIVWESTHTADGLAAAAYGLKINSGSLYLAGFETRTYPPDGNRNMLLRKYDMASGAVDWSKSIDGSYMNESVQAFGVEAGADGYFYLSGLFNMWGSDEEGQPGVARVSEPSSGLTAMTGYKPCSVQLSLMTDTDLAAGTTFYVHYTTDPAGVVFNSAAAQYTFFIDYPAFSGSPVSRLVPGLEAGNGVPVPGQRNIDSPTYRFKLGYQQPSEVAVTELSGSTEAVANTPGTWDRMDRYPNGNLFVLNNAHGERFPLVRDAAGNIYTAGSFNAWGWNSNTAYVRKFSPLGQPVWTRYYSDEYNNSSPVINALALDAAGNLYAAGTKGSDYCMSNDYPCTMPESVTSKDVLLIKYSAVSGRMHWARSYDIDGGNDHAYGLAVSPANVFVAGKFYNNTDANTYDDAFLAALDTDGEVQDLYKLPDVSSGEERFRAVAYDVEGDLLYAAGRIFNGTDADGLVKVFTFDGSLNDEGTDLTAEFGVEDEIYAVAVDTDNAAVYLAGAVDGGMGTQDAYLAKYDAQDLAGGALWEKTYNSTNQNPDEAYGLALDGVGGVYISGTEFRYDLNQGKNIFVRKYNTEGDFIWSQVLNSAGNNEDTAGGIVADRARNVYVAMDAAQMGAVAGGYTVPGTYTVDTINGAGYFKHTQSTMTATNPKLTVRVNKVPNLGLEGVAVAVMSFNQTGGMDPNGIRMGVTDSSGAVNMSLPSGRGYFIAISSHNMVPTITEQISDPNNNFFIELNADATRQYYITDRQPAADPV